MDQVIGFSYGFCNIDNLSYTVTVVQPFPMLHGCKPGETLTSHVHVNTAFSLE